VQRQEARLSALTGSGLAAGGAGAVSEAAVYTREEKKSYIYRYNRKHFHIYIYTDD
jgi:hypothetical protein